MNGPSCLHKRAAKVAQGSKADCASAHDRAFCTRGCKPMSRTCLIGPRAYPSGFSIERSSSFFHQLRNAPGWSQALGRSLGHCFNIRIASVLSAPRRIQQVVHPKGSGLLRIWERFLSLQKQGKNPFWIDCTISEQVSRLINGQGFVEPYSSFSSAATKVNSQTVLLKKAS